MGLNLHVLAGLPKPGSGVLASKGDCYEMTSSLAKAISQGRKVLVTTVGCGVEPPHFTECCDDGM